MNPAPHPSREDVLDAFAVEPRPDRETLERYLRAYPDYAEDLVDLSRELNRDPCSDEAPLSIEEQAIIDAAWRRHSGEPVPGAASDPLSGLSAADLREVARQLDVPRQIIAAFRERRVILPSVPRRFLASLAEALNSSVANLEAVWSEFVTAPTLARSYKADGKPTTVEPVSFERVLIDAGVPEDRRDELLRDAD